MASTQEQPQLAFEAAALLALRSKELGIPAAPWMERATAIAGTDGTWTQLLEMVAAVQPDVFGGDRELMAANPAVVTRIRALLPLWRETLASGGASKEFRTYVEVALVCSYGAPGLALPFITSLGVGLVPLLEYRASLCGLADIARLRPLAEAGFVDAEYALGRGVLDVERDSELALRHFQAAATAFPESLSARTLIGNIYLEWEDWQAALTAFDAVLALRPGHPDALIGRTHSVSSLGRYQDGIDTATRLIEGGTWFLGQAHYWRAWNHNGLKNYPAARVEADRTRTLMVNAGVFLLSGLIDWSLEQREKAEQEFETALTMDFGQCEAAFYLGGVRAEMRKAVEGLAAFRQANQCYDLANVVRRKSIEAIAAGKASDQAKARQIGSHQRAITANDERKAQAARLIGQLDAYLNSLQAPPRAPPPSPSRPARPSPR